MRFILGEKQCMSQIFTEDGVVHPVTVIQSGPMTVIQVKTKAKDGYDAIQYGYGERNEKNINKAQKGHVKGHGNFRYFREVHAEAGANIGDIVPVSVFNVGDVVEVSGVSKGKGFQGVVKRHGFGGGRRSHGQKHSEREPGSIGGGCRRGGRVEKGMRMAGRMGSDRTTIKNLKVVALDAANGQIFVSGAIPGHRGTLIEIKAK